MLDSVEVSVEEWAEASEEAWEWEEEDIIEEEDMDSEILCPLLEWDHGECPLGITCLGECPGLCLNGVVCPNVTPLNGECQSGVLE